MASTTTMTITTMSAITTSAPFPGLRFSACAVSSFYATKLSTEGSGLSAAEIADGARSQLPATARCYAEAYGSRRESVEEAALTRALVRIADGRRRASSCWAPSATAWCTPAPPAAAPCSRWPARRPSPALRAPATDGRAGAALAGRQGRGSGRRLHGLRRPPPRSGSASTRSTPTTTLRCSSCARSVRSASTTWYDVWLPIRPNESHGWVKEGSVAIYTTTAKIVIHLSQHRLLVYRRGLLVGSFTVAVGMPQLPTPTGIFYVNEKLRPPTPGGPYGVLALGLSAYQPEAPELASGRSGGHPWHEPGLADRPGHQSRLRAHAQRRRAQGERPGPDAAAPSSSSSRDDARKRHGTRGRLAGGSGPVSLGGVRDGAASGLTSTRPGSAACPWPCTWGTCTSRPSPGRRAGCHR